MSGRIPRDFINELLVRVDIVDLIDSHVPLKKAGANYVARSIPKNLPVFPLVAISKCFTALVVARVVTQPAF
jgi:hypothetical protein